LPSVEDVRRRNKVEVEAKVESEERRAGGLLLNSMFLAPCSVVPSVEY
jgi:hypothetical protein